MPALGELSISQNLVLSNCDMDPKVDFISQWRAEFPGVKTPDIKFEEVEDVEERLNSCKNVIKSLEEKLKQERFRLIFMQTYLAGKRKSYTRERWGFNKASVSSETDPQSPTPGSGDGVNKQLEAESIAIVTKEDTNSSFSNDVILRSAKIERSFGSTNRRSKVLANVSFFESKADSKEGTGEVEDQTKIGTHKASVRKRAPYFQVWECNTGADEEQKPLNKDEKMEPAEAVESTATAITSRIKPAASQRGSRKDYVEVWRCNTGDQVSVGVVYDDQDDSFDIPIDNTDIDSNQDYDVQDIDMKDGYGKKHYTIAGSDVKLRNMPTLSEDPSMTWPTAVAPFQDNALQAEAEGLDDYSTNIELSDLDNDSTSDSQQSDSSNDESGKVPSHTDQLLLSGLGTSPLHRLRRAQTTNERMTAAYASLIHDFSDEDRATPDRSSLLSAQSTDLLSSDDEVYDHEHISEEDGSPISPPSDLTKSDKPPEIFVYSGRKDTDTESISNDTSLNHKSLPLVDEKLNGPVQAEAVSDMVDYQKVRSIAEAEKLRMRKWVLSLLLDTEEAYLQYLNTLLLYMKPLKATIGTSQPVMSAQDFDTLFYRVPELHNLHADFFDSLKPRLDAWSADTNVGDLFKKLLNKLSLYNDYLNNYKRAQHTVEKCAKENQQFANIIERLKVQSRGTKNSESISLIDVLYKPVERVMRTTLVLQDLLKHTPHRHPDYQVLRQVLKQSQIFLERINSSSSSYKTKRPPSSAIAAARSADRELIKDGFLVEVASDSSRKLRHCFLYSDLLLCAKQKSAAGVFHSKDSYECKWYIPLADLSFKPKEDSDAIADAQLTSEEELREMSDEAQHLKREIARERKRNAKERKGTENSPARSRKEERLRKKLAELEARIVLAAPDLPLRIYHMQGKSYMFLMSSDYERIEWSEAIMKQQETCFKSFSLTSYEITTLLATCAKHKKMTNIGSMLMREDEELLSGYLTVTIHSGQGFLRACNPYCTLEVDSYGQFQTKAKTRPCRDTKTPVWNEEFEIDLEGAMTLRILCYDRAKAASAGASYDDDVLIAKGKVGLIQESLREKREWVEESVLMNELSISVSVKFTPRERSLQRPVSKKASGVFGVSIEHIVKRDSTGIPFIVRKCVTEVERRGMNEVGIYRVSGVASEIQALKASFDADRNDVSVLLGEVDINAVAGVLKLYFRELPEPLFTDAKYSSFIQASSFTDPETKRLTISRLLSDLPAINYKTLYFLRNHLVKVAKNEHANKMSMHNLATVFGPTLLRPAEDKTAVAGQTASHTALMLNALQLDVHYQMEVLLHCLEMTDMQDYESLKNENKKEKSERAEPAPSVSPEKSNESRENDNAKKNRRPIMRTSTVDSNKTNVPKLRDVTQNLTPGPRQRYHAYEEVIFPPKFNTKPQIQKPVVARKPSTEPNGRSAKPTPAPRKPIPAKPAVTTDL